MDNNHTSRISQWDLFHLSVLLEFYAVKSHRRGITEDLYAALEEALAVLRNALNKAKCGDPVSNDER